MKKLFLYTSLYITAFHAGYLFAYESYKDYQYKFGDEEYPTFEQQDTIMAMHQDIENEIQKIMSSVIDGLMETIYGHR